ncbi:flagellar assembly protein FliH [Jeotgalibacillus sp. R-1-5s-1]|nr:flagellar assembly protein FliH [Jeotgalibacillus sp. R-1-5s-1]
MMSLSRVIKSGFVGSNHSEGVAIPFKSITQPEEHSDQTLSWTVEQAKRESRQLLHDAKMKAQEALEEAQLTYQQTMDQIEQHKNNWEEEKQQLQKNAYEEAFAQGYEEGRNKGYDDLTHLLEEAKEIVSSSKDTLHKQLEENEFVILELAIKASEKIMSVKLEDDPAAFLPIVKKGIKEAREMREIKIYTAIQQFTFLQQEREELLSIFPVDVKLYIYPEEELEPFQCFIESSQGRIDISIDTQLTELKAGLAEVLGSGK